jgi:hypothetical protein
MLTDFFDIMDGSFGHVIDIDVTLEEGALAILQDHPE